MSEQKRYPVLSGIIHAIVVMFTGAIVTLVIFMISPEFLMPAKTMFADHVVKILMGGGWFFLGWMVRGIYE